MVGKHGCPFSGPFPQTPHHEPQRPQSEAWLVSTLEKYKWSELIYYILKKIETNLFVTQKRHYVEATSHVLIIDVNHVEPMPPSVGCFPYFGSDVFFFFLFHIWVWHVFCARGQTHSFMGPDMFFIFEFKLVFHNSGKTCIFSVIHVLFSFYFPCLGSDKFFFPYLGGQTCISNSRKFIVFIYLVRHIFIYGVSQFFLIFSARHVFPFNFCGKIFFSYFLSDVFFYIWDQTCFS